MKRYSNILAFITVVTLMLLIVACGNVQPSEATATATAVAAESSEAVDTAAEATIAHGAYWTEATESSRWPDLGEFDIVVGHFDPDENGNAKAVILVKGKRDIMESDLVGIYFNAYTGTLTDATKQQIINEIQDSVRPHVPGFTLNDVSVTQLP